MNKQFNRQRRHNNNRSGRSVALQQITRFTNFDSSGPLGKLRGTPLQLAEKYQAGAKDAQTQGDVIMAQTCLQYADHYLRLQAIALENEQAKIKPMEQPVPESDIDSDIPQNEPQPTENTEATPKTVMRHKKKVDDGLSMPMDALQEKSESAE